MNILEYTKLIEEVIPIEVHSKSARQSFKRRASSYQLGDGDKFLKVSFISQESKLDCRGSILDTAGTASVIPHFSIVKPYKLAVNLR